MDRGVLLCLLALAACKLEEHPAWLGPASATESGTGTSAGSDSATSGTPTATGTSAGPGGTTTGSTSSGSGTTAVTATGGGSTGGTTGGISPPTPCVQAWIDGTMQIGTPEPLGVLNSGEFDGDPFLTGNGLTIFFASDRASPGSSDLYYSTRATVDDPWGTPMPLDDVNTNDGEWTFAVAGSGRLAFFISDRPGGPGGSDVWQVTRPSKNDPWANPEPVIELSTQQADWDIWLSPDALTAYLNHGGNNADNVWSERTSVMDGFAPPMDVGFNTMQTESSPALSADLRVLFYGSYKGGGQGGQDLYYAVRQEPTDGFNGSDPVPVLNTPDNEGEVHLDRTGCELYFTRGAGGLNTWDLYRVVITP